MKADIPHLADGMKLKKVTGYGSMVPKWILLHGTAESLIMVSVSVFRIICISTEAAQDGMTASIPLQLRSYANGGKIQVRRV